MRKYLIALCFALLIALSGYAQTVKVYGKIDSARKSVTGKATISVSFGQIKIPDSSKIVDQDGKPLTFETMVDAMNYMSQLGWSFVSPYCWVLGNGPVMVAENSWIISKEIPESDIIENVSEPVPAGGK